MFKEKELLPHFLEFDKLLQTLMTSYERDLDNLIEIVCDDSSPLMDKFGLELVRHLSTAPYCVTNDDKIGQLGLFQTFQ